MRLPRTASPPPSPPLGRFGGAGSQKDALVARRVVENPLPGVPGMSTLPEVGPTLSDAAGRGAPRVTRYFAGRLRPLPVIA